MARGRTDYGFLRSFAAVGSDPTQFRNLQNAGYGGVLINYSDPELAQAVAAAQQAGISFGFWGDPNAVGNNNAAYVARMAALNAQYHPDLLAPDLESAYRGDPGSAGWNNMADIANRWQAAGLGNVRTAVTPMGSPFVAGKMADYNTKPWGANTEWWPQAYGADPRQTVYGPQDIVASMVANGIDPSMVSPILAGANAGTYGGGALWTIDDYYPYGGLGQLPKASALAPHFPPAGGTPAAPTGGTTRSSGPSRPQPAGRLTQTQQQVASSGLRWSGQTFSNRQDFSRFLQARGSSYSNWAANHPQAAAGLQGRK